MTTYKYNSYFKFWGTHFENRRSYSTGIRQKGDGTSTNLVLWGINLSSTVGERFTRSQLSTLSLSSSLNPYFITGLADAESSFIISIVLNNKYRTGGKITPYFSIELHGKDLLLLKQIQAFFGVGSIKVRKSNNQVIFSVTSVKDLILKIIPHFEKYPLITQKRADYILFKSIVNLMNRKEHLTLEGLRQIVGIRAAMNNGLSEKQKAVFSDVIPVKRPLVVDQEIQDPNWLAGFSEGEGCFFVDIFKSTTHKIGYQVKLKFVITQHVRDIYLIESFTKFLGCGKVVTTANGLLVQFIVSNFSDIVDIIIPFLKKYPVYGVKALDFADFQRAAEIMKVKGHLTKDGLDQIRILKAEMNRGRQT